MALASMVLNPNEYYGNTDTFQLYQIATDIFTSLLEDSSLINVIKDGVCHLDYKTNNFKPRELLNHTTLYFPLNIDLENAIDKVYIIEKVLGYSSQSGDDYITLGSTPIVLPLVILSRLGNPLHKFHKAQIAGSKGRHDAAFNKFSHLYVED